MHHEKLPNIRGRYAFWTRIAFGALLVAFTTEPAMGQIGPCNLPPVISSCPGTVTVATGPNATTCSQVAMWTAPTATGCTALTATSNHSPGDVFPVGTTPVTYTFTDQNSHSSTCSFNVSVVDNTLPHIFAPSHVNANADAGTCTASNVDLGQPYAYDNCGFTVTSNAPSTFNLGTTTITWTVTDASGNTATDIQTVTVVDKQAPIPNVIQLPTITGLCSASVTPPTATDNCVGTVLGTTTDPTTYTVPGTYTVNWTFDDGHGNPWYQSQTVKVLGTACSITVTPSNTTYTGGVPTNIYLGYGPQSATINVAPGGLNYSWSPAAHLSCSSCAHPVFTPTAAGIYTYTVTALNSSGCNTTCTVTFCVRDVRVAGKHDDDDEKDNKHGNNGNNSGKVYLCHVPNGNSNNAQTLSISVNAVAAHLSNHAGDHLGACSQICGTSNRSAAQEEIVIGEDVQVYPNPNTGLFVVQLPYIEDKAQITVTDVQGKVISRKVVTDSDGNRISFDLGTAPRGMYFVEVACSHQRFRTKMIVQ